MGLVTIAHFIPEVSPEERGRWQERRGRDERAVSSNSMRGRFGSPIFGLEHFRTLQTLPPRIELSVQISILTANLPANSPPAPSSSCRLVFSPSTTPVLNAPAFLAPRVFLFADRRSVNVVPRANALSLASRRPDASNFLTAGVLAIHSPPEYHVYQ